MHILIIPSWYKTKNNPVVGSFFEEQARGLIKLGHKVGVIYPSFYAFTSKNVEDDSVIFDKGILTYYSSYKAIVPRCRKLNYVFFAKKNYKTYLRYIKENGTPDIIHAHTVFYGGIAAAYISKKSTIPFVITEHFTSFITGGISHSQDFEISRKIFLESKCNIIVSEGFKVLLIRKLNLPVNSFNVIPNMVDNNFLKTALNKTIDKKEPIFFTMSFLSERKNHKLMLDAFALLLKKIPNSKFRIGGDGKIKQELKKYTEKIGVSENVFFLGELSRAEVVKEMAGCDIFLLASKFETFGVVLIEALASGKPVITTDSIGPRDIVNKQNGVIISNFETDAFCQAMLNMVMNYELYDSKLIRDDCEKRFSEEVVISKLEKIYRAEIGFKND